VGGQSEAFEEDGKADHDAGGENNIHSADGFGSEGEVVDAARSASSSLVPWKRRFRGNQMKPKREARSAAIAARSAPIPEITLPGPPYAWALSGSARQRSVKARRERRNRVVERIIMVVSVELLW
jgi:hypothetical protein